MQPAARDGLTADQVASLIRDTPALGTSAGLELLDIGLNVLDDLSTDLEGGTVGRANYATLHGSADLSLARELDWGTAIVRPYMRLTAGTVTARFNLGAYLTSTPLVQVGEYPVVHDVHGYDILHWLNTAVGESYTVDAGVGYLAAVEQILTTQGIVAYRIDQTSAAKVLPTAKSWAFADDTTWLNVINDLLAAIGYQGLYSDWDGLLRAQPYQLPAERPVEWVYDVDPDSSMLALKRVRERDLFDAPNRWVFYWSKDPSGAAPVEGNGIYIYQNETNGPTSITARRRIISAKPQRLDVVDQASLVAMAQRSIDADLRLKTTFKVPTAPNPLHWHFDKLTLADPDLGPLQDVLAVRWDLPLDGGDMAHEWSAV